MPVTARNRPVCTGNPAVFEPAARPLSAGRQTGGPGGRYRPEVFLLVFYRIQPLSDFRSCRDMVDKTGFLPAVPVELKEGFQPEAPTWERMDTDTCGQEARYCPGCSVARVGKICPGPGISSRGGPFKVAHQARAAGTASTFQRSGRSCLVSASRTAPRRRRVSPCPSCRGARIPAGRCPCHRCARAP